MLQFDQDGNVPVLTNPANNKKYKVRGGFDSNGRSGVWHDYQDGKEVFMAGAATSTVPDDGGAAASPSGGMVLGTDSPTNLPNSTHTTTPASTQGQTAGQQHTADTQNNATNGGLVLNGASGDPSQTVISLQQAQAAAQAQTQAAAQAQAQAQSRAQGAAVDLPGTPVVLGAGTGGTTVKPRTLHETSGTGALSATSKQPLVDIAGANININKQAADGVSITEGKAAGTNRHPVVNISNATVNVSKAPIGGITINGDPIIGSPVPGPKGGVVQTEHVVVHGDTLSGIAAKNGLTLHEIEALNPKITDPNIIHPGEVIHLTPPLAPVTGSLGGDSGASGGSSSGSTTSLVLTEPEPGAKTTVSGRLSMADTSNHSGSMNGVEVAFNPPTHSSWSVSSGSTKADEQVEHKNAGWPPASVATDPVNNVMAVNAHQQTNPLEGKNDASKSNEA